MENELIIGFYVGGLMKDKILFFIDSWFLNFGMAELLQKRTDMDFYAIIDFEDKAKKFFQEQNLV